jgi:hypothetical protein
MGQLALSVAGAVIGGVAEGIITGGAGFAQGAEIGWALGGIAGAIIFNNQGPQQTDLRVQDSAYGKAIPNVYGLYRCAGNVIWAGDPIEYTGGKGGPSNGPSVLISLAVGICKGPIEGIRRIWANGVLIYDITNPSDFSTITGSNQMITNFTVYNGDENQLPDPTMEATLGVGNVPPFRGLAYVVFNELDLNGWGNYIPSLSFEVMADTPTTYSYTNYIPLPEAPAFGGSPGSTTTTTTQYDVQGAWAFLSGLIPDRSNQVGLQAVRFTADGVSYYGFLTNIGLDFPCARCQSYDEFGILTTQGKWVTPGLGIAYQTGLSTDLGGSGTTVIKRNDRFYLAEYIGGAGNPLNVWDFGLQTLYVGNTISGWFLVGVSDSFVYAIGINSADTYYNWLCQFDLFGNFIAKLWQDANFGSAPVGYFVSDSEIYINGGGTTQTIMLWNGSTLVSTGIPADYSAENMEVINGGAYFQGSGNLGVQQAFYAVVPGYTPSPTPLSAIVADMCSKAGLASNQYDVSSLTDTCWGFAITNHSSVRANITPLMASYFFDACDTDSVVKFRRRGGQPVGTFYYADLGASNEEGDDDNQNPITLVIAQDIDLPKSLSFTYPALNNDYLVNTQRAFRTATESNQQLASKAPIVMGDSEALTRVQSMLWAAWVGRKTFTFSTRLSYIQYEPGDVMYLQGAQGQLYTVCITDVSYDGQGVLRWQARLEEPDIYPNATVTAAGGQAIGFNHQNIAYSGLTIFAAIDVPPLRDTDTSQKLYLAACGMNAGWPGCSVQVSRDGNSYSSLLQINSPSVMGIALTALGNFSGGNQPDELNTVTVNLYGVGTLSSVSYSNFLAGLNACYLGGEVLFFVTPCRPQLTPMFFRACSARASAQNTQWGRTP